MPGSHCEDDPTARRARRDDAEPLRALAGRLFLAHEALRRSVARQLHNGPGQALTAVTMAAHAALREDDAAQRAADLEEIAAQAQAALAQVRQLCGLLHPPPLDAIGLEAALRWHLAQLQDDAPVDLVLEASGLRQRPAPEVEQACFRIAEEAMANAFAHARARRIAVHLHDMDDGFEMEVRDDGRGFAADSTAGPGLTEMGERARAIGARFSIDSGRGQGTCVRVRVPGAAARGPAGGDAA